MPTNGKLVAWIEPRGRDLFLAAFVGAAAATKRPPATRLCTSHRDARQWVVDQAADFGLPVQWLNEAPQR